MNTRSCTSAVVFNHPFSLAGSSKVLPAGRYEVLVEEEMIDGLSFPAFRETAAYLLIFGSTPGAGPKEMRATSTADLEAALARDAGLSASAQTAGPPPTEGSSGEADAKTAAQAQDDLPQGRIARWIRTLTSHLP